MADELTRIAIVNADKCKPKKCSQECKKNCPINRSGTGKLCIEVNKSSKIATISEYLCNGCNICVKKCPFGAISIIRIPKNLEKDVTYQYGPNMFKLHRLPIPRPSKVLGLVGKNGIGKTTALKILSGKIKPNFGKPSIDHSWKEIVNYYRGSELQSYFTDIMENKLNVVTKPQYVDQIPKAIKGSIRDILDKYTDVQNIVETLRLTNILDRQIENLSGGELQRFTIALTCLNNASVYIFDEPTSYLDIKQRLVAASVIRKLCKMNVYVIAVEHDLSILDYLSDYVCCMYGDPGAYGVVTTPFGVREGINIFLSGFIPTENLRFRDSSLVFKIPEDNLEHGNSLDNGYFYPIMNKVFGSFKLTVKEGTFHTSEIIIMLGENGTGKTTFIKMLAEHYQRDDSPISKLRISYKPQKLSPKYQGTVKELLQDKIPHAISDEQFKTDVFNPLNIKSLFDQPVSNLSGGELQRVAICLCLGKVADVYLIDEPSAYLDSEQRLITSKIIKNFIMHSKKTAFVVEHDFIMATYLADRVILFEGEASVDCTANSPQMLLSGMNKFLSSLQVTFRRDPTNYRPRINKLDSIKDKVQKSSGNYFFTDE